MLLNLPEAVLCQIEGSPDIQNVMSMPRSASVYFQGFGSLLALNIRCFVLTLFFFLSNFCSLFSAILWVNLDLSGIYGVVSAKRDIIVDNM